MFYTIGPVCSVSGQFYIDAWITWYKYKWGD